MDKEQLIKAFMAWNAYAADPSMPHFSQVELDAMSPMEFATRQAESLLEYLQLAEQQA
jgi:hypothetical protein